MTTYQETTVAASTQELTKVRYTANTTLRVVGAAASPTVMMAA
jgi:hypothetical protein